MFNPHTAPDDCLPETVRDLGSFDPGTRRAALERIAGGPRPPAGSRPLSPARVNNHAHTFFSYSSLDLSPSALVREAVRHGLAVVGSADFDVLDALEEMYLAGSLLDMRVTVSLETRAFARDFADREVNSPGEPGIVYVMGAGFAGMPPESGPDGVLYSSLAVRSRRRNQAVIARINEVLAAVAIDYEKDVLPLTPSGNATERHICRAYDEKARNVFPGAEALAAFWAERLGLSVEAAAELVRDSGALRNAVRAKFMKGGGIGYVRPDPDSFPAVEDFFRMVDAAGAVPCLAWLDGLSAGEADADALLDAAVSWGAGAVNVIPDRNWNIADPDLKARKLAALERFVRAARERRLPVLAGTELNGPGQKFVDSFDAPELAPYVDDFRAAAFWLYGHGRLERDAGMGARSAWARRAFGAFREKANAFYERAGRLLPPGEPATTLDPDMDCEQALAALSALAHPGRTPDDRSR